MQHAFQSHCYHNNNIGPFQISSIWYYLNLLTWVKKSFIIIELYLSIGELNKPIYDLFIKSGVSKP